ncbi:MAG: hypothetical protein L0387_27560 [Acidobacteria bacterium]|nr:hypothetical protein [Acidobacteriota bacterium]MCI0625359.1 hypothetical protein [Acidobacteriota bacterium]MCI0720404.1 hypothetical protein [Acidobacteriota bacterium]
MKSSPENHPDTSSKPKEGPIPIGRVRAGDLPALMVSARLSSGELEAATNSMAKQRLLLVRIKSLSVIEALN